MKEMEDEYACLLCDERIKAKCSVGSTITRMKKHLKSSVHKLKYLVSISNLKQFSLSKGTIVTYIIYIISLILYNLYQYRMLTFQK